MLSSRCARLFLALVAEFRHRRAIRALQAFDSRMLAVAMAELVALEAPHALKPYYEFSVSQARANRDVIFRYGRFPHRNPVLGRVSTPAEAAYLAKGDFVHKRRPLAPSPSLVPADGNLEKAVT